jgi:hypothetical protein
MWVFTVLKWFLAFALGAILIGYALSLVYGLVLGFAAICAWIVLQIDTGIRYTFLQTRLLWASWLRLIEHRRHASRKIGR